MEYSLIFMLSVLTILPTTLSLHLVEPIDAKEKASIKSMEILPMLASVAVPIMLHRKIHLYHNQNS